MRVRTLACDARPLAAVDGSCVPTASATINSVPRCGSVKRRRNQIARHHDPMAANSRRPSANEDSFTASSSCFMPIDASRCDKHLTRAAKWTL